MSDPGNLNFCELRVAALPGYRASSVKLSAPRGTDTSDVGIMILKRIAGREGDTISVTNAMAPKNAAKALDKARQLLVKHNTAEAREELMKAVAIYPRYAAAWLELGHLQLNSDQPVEARKSFEKALEADPKYLRPYEGLALVELRERRWQDLADTTDRMLQLNSYDYPQGYYYNALAQLNLNHPEAAEKSAREALRLDPQKFGRAGYVATELRAASYTISGAPSETGVPAGRAVSSVG